jgi:Zn-finger nucleic acid-binding protein
MKCPICKTVTLGEITLIEKLPAKQCSTCGGVWIDSNAYLAWWKGRGEDLPVRESASQMDPSWNVDELKLCPNSGHIMKRYKVFPDTEFYLDRCGHCNGIWFDKHEWDALVERNWHDNINEFFTRPWQDDIHAAETWNHMDRLYRDKLGAEDYERIKQVRAWLREHPRWSMLLAFLQADDPYKV